MPDRLFTDPSLAELYDLWHPWQRRGDFSFYLPLVMAAGTGSLSPFLSGAGLVISEQFGGWDRQPLTAASPEIITIARPG